MDTSLHALRGIKPRSVGQCAERTEYRSDSLIPARGRASTCAWGSRNATRHTHSSTQHGSCQREITRCWGSVDPCRGPTEKGATPTPNPTTLKFFTLPRIQSSLSYLYFLLYYNRNRISVPFISTPDTLRANGGFVLHYILSILT